MEYVARAHREDNSYWAEVEELAGTFAAGDSVQELYDALAEAIALVADGPEPVVLASETSEILPTEATAHTGFAFLVAAGEAAYVSEGCWWYDHGDYIIRSTEYPLIAGAATFEAALTKFAEMVVDFIVFLQELPDRVDSEEEMLSWVRPRLRELAGANAAAAHWVTANLPADE